MKIENGKAYWCEDEDTGKKFLQLCEEQGILWQDGQSATTANYWNWHLYNTCYFADSYSNGYRLSQINRDSAITRKMEIINAKTLFNKENKMSKAKLTAENGKTIEVEITEEQRKELFGGKPSVGDKYYFVDSYGDTDCIDWDNDDYDNYRYDTGNYYETEALALKDIAKFGDDIKKYFGGNE